MALTDQEKINCLRLMMSDHIGPITYGQLLDFFGTATEALNHIDEVARHGGRKKNLVLCPKGVAEKQFEIAEKQGVRILFRQDNGYPRLLMRIPGGAPVLFVRGNEAAFSQKSVAIVGTRNASLNGKALARKIAFDLAEADYCVVSGMAHGIDRAAHMGALGTPKIAKTVAVLGTPVDEIYPQENADIYEQIAERGCLVSEFPFGTPLNPRNFPRRNRIISGLALGVVVIEAQERSGSLITAREAADQGREVMAVPGSPVDPRSAGPNTLIREGATLISSARDVIGVLEDNTFRLTEKQQSVEYRSVPPTESVLTDARDILWNMMGSDVVSVDDLIRASGLDARIVNIILMELAVAGRLERHPGNRVSLIYSLE